MKFGTPNVETQEDNVYVEIQVESKAAVSKNREIV